MLLPTDLLAALGALPGDWHAAGCLEMPNLEALAKHAVARQVRRSVETGAGKSTLLLSHLSDHHTVFAVNDGESLTRTRDNDLLRQDRVEFVDGPSQLTLLQHDFAEPLQLVFIDGPHGFPFPNLEYWKLYPHIEPGGLLVIDDIHIPTIRQLFDFLVEDEMFRLLETVGKTAFFERTKAPTFSPVGDGWWLQRYNARRFPVPYADLGALVVHEPKPNSAVYRERLLPLIARWKAYDTKVAIFGIGGHTHRMFELVPELNSLQIVAYLDTSATVRGTTYRGVAVQHPSWTEGNADVILCSSYAHELAQMALVDQIPVKAVLSHPPSHTMMSDVVVERARRPEAA
jgi:predicted O-methyltransferase YrrM